MRLTAKDIYNKTFKRAFKGYDDTEVDEFLDVIIKDFVDMNDEITRLSNDRAQFASDIDTLRRENARLTAERDNLAVKSAQETEEVKYRQSANEEKIVQALLAAQKTADLMITEAHAKADVIVKEANDKAERIAGMQYVQLAKQKKNIALIRSLIEQSKADYESVVGKSAELFKGTTDSILANIDNFDADNLDAQASEFTLPEKQELPPAAEPATSCTIVPDTPDEAIVESVASELTQGAPAAYAETPKFKSQYSDYSWLYDDDGGETIDVTLPKPSPEAEKHLQQLIDEITE